jgi:SAM-dependent methyltransferase
MTHDAVTDGFEELYRGETTLGGFLLDTVPWDIGEPQPAVVALEEGRLVVDDVLDVGCGPGDNALYLAERGHRVTACDAAPSAVGRARDKARLLGLDVEFAVADATRLDGWAPHRFRTVLDSALFHCLPQRQHEQYAATLHRVCQAGARLHLLCVSDRVPAGIPVPSPVARDDIDRALGAWWHIRDVQPDTFTTEFTRQGLQHLLERQGRSRADLRSLTLDGEGRVLLPTWRVEAERLPGPTS